MTGQSANLGRQFHPDKSCLRKIAFRSYGKAAKAARGLTSVEREDPGEIRPYLCRHCGMFHVGHKP